MHTFLLTTGVEATWLQDVEWFSINLTQTLLTQTTTHTMHTYTHTHTTTLPCVIPTLLF